jgi:GAF domain-containing protein
MRRRSQVGNVPVKARRRKATPPKRRNAPKAARRSSSGSKEVEIARLTRELSESLQRQVASAAVLKIISRSTFDLSKVLNTLLEAAARLCDADKGIILRPTGKNASYYTAASYRHTSEYNEHQKHLIFAPGRSGIVGRVLLEGKSVQIPDVFADPEYTYCEIARLGDFRTILGVPLIREGTPIGILVLHCAAVRPFTGKQIKLVETFADYAVIAIENTRLFEAEQQRTRELSESLEQQTATSAVLRTISSSPADLQSVFQSILTNATRICEANFGTLFRYDGGGLVLAAWHGVPRKYLKLLQSGPVPVDEGTVTGRAAKTGQVIHITDILAELPDNKGHPLRGRLIELGKVRTLLVVPMLKEGQLVGAISIYRTEVRPFTDKQIALVTNFANQAVIAIENARLLNELRQRTTDLTESLEQQTATSDVLRVISSSPGELQPVFQAMLENAVRICGAKFGNLWLREGDFFRIGATTRGAPAAYVDFLLREGPFGAADRRVALGLLLETKRAYQIADTTLEPTFNDKLRVATIELAGARTLIGVPLLKDDNVVGCIVIYRQEVRPFTDKQIELVTTFADQAVIAIENTRLLNELRQRTTDLTESLEQQTATSDVLRVISSSPGELQPVFQAMLENAVRICNAKFGNIHRWDGDALALVATHNTPPAYAEIRKRYPFRPDASNPTSRMLRSKTVIHGLDLREEETYIKRLDPGTIAAAEIGGVRTFLIVPMLKGDELIGSFNLFRQEVRPFSEKQIALVTGFANQAVIAIENARLLNELRQRTTDLTERTADLTEALEQQTATSEVLQVISSSPGDLQPVFATMLEKAVRICDANFGNIYRWDGEVLHLLASHNTPPALADARKHSPLRPYAETPVGRMVVHKAAFHSADMTAMPGYIDRSDPGAVAAIELGGVRTILAIPMLKENEMIGSFSVYRQEVRPFTDKQIALVTNFAAQAVIAIENARLLKELRERTEEVEKLNQQLEQRVADQVGEIERMSRLRRFLPPQVADLIVASGAEKQLESHRREITALFCDLRGFTGFSESADPEDVMALLREYHAAIGEIIIKYSGTLERYAGDGVMVVFNDPVPVPKPALQAVQAALDMRAAIGALTEKWSRLGHDLGFGVGIAHGHATLGTIGFEGRFDYSAIGTVSNVASRLCDEAKPGQILISPRVLMAVEDAVTVEPVGEFELKGIRRPVAAYNVVAALPPSP